MFGIHITLVVGSSLFLFAVTGNCKAVTESPYTSLLVNVHATQGKMIGTVLPEGGMFKGIPFSQTTAGENRWKNPRDPVPFPNGVWNATYYRPGCMQNCNQDKFNLTCPEHMSEDCLYLNVWVPTSVLEESDNSDDATKGKHYVISEKYREKREDGLAVMLFIHGGTFMFGAGSSRLYDGRFMSSQGDVIIVTINYRLGAFGFLVQSGGEAEGNYAIYDQIAALKWVQKNIASFGGNPNKVTIFGESAGAESVGTLLATDASKGLFHQAIMESNPFALPFRTKAGAEKYGAKFAEAAKCKAGDMKCLRAVGPKAILEASKNLKLLNILGQKKSFMVQPWSPVIDGKFLEELPLFAFMNGRAMKIPIILGTTQDEALLFVTHFFKTPSVKNWEYLLALLALFRSKAIDVLDKYPYEKDNRYAMGKLVTDFMFKAPNRAAAFGTTPQTWFYLFNETVPLFNEGLCADKVCHTAELPYVFDTLNFMPSVFTESQKILGKRMVEYWTNFAKYGNPNGESEEKNKGGDFDAISWPEFCPDGNHNNYKSIKMEAKGDTIITNELKQLSDFWDGLNLYGKLK